MQFNSMGYLTNLIVKLQSESGFLTDISNISIIGQDTERGCVGKHSYEYYI